MYYPPLLSALSSDYLEHHGILGMKWGVRRYQNKDGSLTQAGKKRYAEALDEKSKAVKLAKEHSDTADDDLRRAKASKNSYEEYRKNRLYYETGEADEEKSKSMIRKIGHDTIEDYFMKSYGDNLLSEFEAFSKPIGSDNKSVFDTDIEFASRSKEQFNRVYNRISNLTIDDLDRQGVKNAVNKIYQEELNNKKHI